LTASQKIGFARGEYGVERDPELKPEFLPLLFAFLRLAVNSAQLCFPFLGMKPHLPHLYSPRLRGRPAVEYAFRSFFAFLPDDVDGVLVEDFDACSSGVDGGEGVDFATLYAEDGIIDDEGVSWLYCCAESGAGSCSLLCPFLACGVICSSGRRAVPCAPIFRFKECGFL